MATGAVLDTYELLENILARLPGPEILRAKKVCRAWRTLAQGSSRLIQACVVAPRTPFYSPYFGKCDESVPVYPESAQLRLNPCLPAGECFEDGRIMTQITIDFDKMPYYRAAENEYVTSPPCETIMLHTGAEYAVCTVYIKTGIRIKDLLDMTDALIEHGDKWSNAIGRAHAEIVGCEYGWWQDGKVWMCGPKMRSLRDFYPVVDEQGLRHGEMGRQVPMLRYTGQKAGWSSFGQRESAKIRETIAEAYGGVWREVGEHEDQEDDEDEDNEEDE